MRKNRSISVYHFFSVASVVAFVFIYALDPLFYLFEKLVSNSPFQFGFAGILLAILSLAYFVGVKKNYGQWLFLLLLVMLFVLSGLVSWFTADNFRLFDGFLFIKMLSYVALGYWFSAAYSDGVMTVFTTRSSFFLVVNTLFLFAIMGLMAFVGNVNYLRVANAVFVYGLFFLSLNFEDFRYRYFFIWLLLVALYCIGSRAALFGGFIAVFFVYNMIFKNLKKKLLLVFLFFMVVLFFGIYAANYEGNLHANRYVRILKSPSSDTSLLSRFQLAAYGMEVVNREWPWGKYKYYEGNPEAGYIHDVRSFVAEFGAAGLLLSLLIYGFLLVRLLKSKKNIGINKKFFFYGLVSFTLINGLFLKHFSYNLAYFCFGFVLFMYRRNPSAGIRRKTPEAACLSAMATENL